MDAYTVCVQAWDKKRLYPYCDTRRPHLLRFQAIMVLFWDVSMVSYVYRGQYARVGYFKHFTTERYIGGPPQVPAANTP